MKNDKDNQIKIKKRIIKDLKNKLKNNSNNTSLEHNVFKNVYYSKNGEISSRSNCFYSLGILPIELNQKKGKILEKCLNLEEENSFFKKEITNMDNNLKKKDYFIQILQEKIHDFSK